MLTTDRVNLGASTMRLLLHIFYTLHGLIFIEPLVGHWKQQSMVKREKGFWS